MPDSAKQPNITAVILAGGRARRLQGADKALLEIGGQPLLAHLIAAIRPQVSRLLINSNRPEKNYAAFGLPVIADSLPDHPGPLAGILAALEHDEGEWLLAVPCDMPFLPPDLVARLLSNLRAQDADVCSPSDGAQLHAAIVLLHRRVQPALRDYLAAGQRKVQDWLHLQRLAIADFSDCPDAFANVNTAQDLTRLQQQVCTT